MREEGSTTFRIFQVWIGTSIRPLIAPVEEMARISIYEGDRSVMTDPFMVNCDLTQVDMHRHRVTTRNSVNELVVVGYHAANSQMHTVESIIENKSTYVR